MKILSSAISLALVFTTLVASGQNPAIKKRMQEIKQKFDLLSPETKDEYVELKKKAFEASRNKKIFTCMVAISDALAIFPDDIDLIYVRGVCRAMLHDADAAVENYNEVLKINPYHFSSLMNLLEINFFAGRYEEAVKHITQVRKLLQSRGGSDDPLLNFKYLISITKLERENPGKYADEIKTMHSLYTFMDDNPYYYYAKALKEFEVGNENEGTLSIYSAYIVFRNPKLIDTWNKTLVDTGFLEASDIMLKLRDNEESSKKRGR